MLEVGTGAQMIFCVAGINGTQALLPELLLKMAGEYCRAYECGWKLDEFYEVKKLLDKIRICLIPILNPDGYEIRQNGFGAIRNPVYRQMLRMQSIPGAGVLCPSYQVNLSNTVAGCQCHEQLIC